MPIIKSAKKRVRIAEKRNVRNRALRTYMKNLRKKVSLSIQAEETDRETASKMLNLYKSKANSAWSKGLFKRNKSSRLVSSMEILFNKKFSSTSQEA